MAAPLKNMYNNQFVAHFATIVQSACPRFDKQRFAWRIFDHSWERLELKERMHHITASLHAELPSAYPEAIDILRQIAPQCEGFPYLIFPNFVEQYGFTPDHEDYSLAALELFTQYSSAEFAIRPFIKRNPAKVMRHMLEWTTHKSHHVRRLASEGCRPRLPWATALPEFQNNKTRVEHDIVPILEALKQDESDYVRRSVANNLNDIAKDHPALVLELVQAWKGQHPFTDRILKHGCRTLFKRGNTTALDLWGFTTPTTISIHHFHPNTHTLAIGETVEYTFELSVGSVAEESVIEQNVRIDLGVDYVKANGSVSRKVFKLLERQFASGSHHTIRRKHRFHDMTTRKHYAGKHRLVLIVNGTECADITLLLQ
jgi:3-methyladenine DNA glycosylase AlkC